MRFSNALRLSCILLVAACTATSPDDDPAGPGGGGGDDTPTDPDGPGGGGGGGELGERRIIGYFPSWAVYARDYHVHEIPAEHLTHINYAFLNISAEGDCILGDSYADIDKFYEGDTWDAGALRGSFHQLQLLKAQHPHLQTLLSIGGWTWSTHFSDVALTAESRARFARSCADLMEQYGFDGLDVDWEYPGGGGLAPGRPEDTVNFTLLLAEMRAELDRRGEYLLTIAAPAGAARIADIEVDQIHQHLDFINVMTYDFHGTWENVTGFNAGLRDVEAALDLWLDGGTPPDKLVAGVPFYGRGWQGVGAGGDGYGQPATGAAMGTWEAGVFDWHDLEANYLPTMTRHWDAEQQVPWLYDPGTGVMISYDDPESIAAKVALVRDRGLGGVMFWELAGDDAEGELLRTVHEGLSQ